MKPIQIKTGVVHIPVERDGENVGEISFNPNDNIWIEKFYKLIGEFEKKQVEYERRAKELEENQEKDEHGIAKNIAAGIAFRREVCENFWDKVDILFGEGTAQIVFGNTLEPELIGQFFNGISRILENERSEKIEKHINENLSGKVMK
ncbi:MAG: hypothetical protein ABFD51_13100 [Anaerolineaceae bacterium]|jgi:hypothetical protein